MLVKVKALYLQRVREPGKLLMCEEISIHKVKHYTATYCKALVTEYNQSKIKKLYLKKVFCIGFYCGKKIGGV
jgi:hypothetical protein